MNWENILAESYDLTELLVGVGLCAVGWTLYWVGLHAVGASLGGCAGGLLGLALDLVLDESGQYSLFVIGGCACLGALLGVFLIRKIHNVAFFVLGVLGGLLAAKIIWPSVPTHFPQFAESDVAPIVFHFILALIAGLLTVFFNGYIIVLVTSLIGSALVVGNLSPELSGMLFVGLFGLSVLFQLFCFYYTKVGRRQRPTEEDA